MAPQVWYMKQGNTLPVITATLVDQSGNVANLTGASVHFHMTNPFFGNVVNAAATIVNPTAGQVSYTWQTGDTNSTGTFACEWYVVFGSGAQETYPQGYYNTVQIDPALTSGFTPAVQPTLLFNTVWNSTSVPTALQGNNGDFWINTATEMLYGPKTSGAWGAGTTLVPSAGTSLSYFSPPTANINMGGFGFSNLGSTTFNNLVAAPSTVGTTALVANNPSGTTSDIADFQINGTTWWKVTSAGNLGGIGQLVVAPTSTSLTPMVLNSPSGTSAKVADYQINGTSVFSVNSSGNTVIGNSKQIDLTGAATSPFLGPAATTYTPTWTQNAGSNPAIGNGTLSGKYFKWGRMVTVFIGIAAGSTTTWGTSSGTDFWEFSLPFTPAATAGGYYGGDGVISVAAGLFPCTALALVSGPYIFLMVNDGTTAGASDKVGASAYTFASTSLISFSVTYEATT